MQNGNSSRKPWKTAQWNPIFFHFSVNLEKKYDPGNLATDNALIGVVDVTAQYPFLPVFLIGVPSRALFHLLKARMSCRCATARHIRFHMFNFSCSTATTKCTTKFFVGLAEFILKAFGLVVKCREQTRLLWLSLFMNVVDLPLILQWRHHILWKEVYLSSPFVSLCPTVLNMLKMLHCLHCGTQPQALQVACIPSY